MRRAARVAAVAVVGAVALGSAGTYLALRVAEQRERAATPPAEGTVTELADVVEGPRIVFRSTALDETYGRVAVVDVDDPAGPRAVTDVACERVFATEDTGLCLTADRGVVTTYRTLVLDADLAVSEELPLVGLPSRARLSPDGALAATTTFVTGHSYAAGTFSTETVVWDVDGESYGNIQEFDLVVDGELVTAVDRNMWGVTFADDDTFYATAASGETTWLVRGSLSQRTLEAVREDAECPSLSPDGTRLVYKKREGAVSGTWRLALYDLQTGEERLLQETRSVDDQVEWLDDGTIVYGIPREGADAAVSDVWALDVGGTAEPEVLVPRAWSPAVVR